MTESPVGDGGPGTRTVTIGLVATVAALGGLWLLVIASVLLGSDAGTAGITASPPATTATTTTSTTTTSPPSSPVAATLVQGFTASTLSDGRSVTVLIVFERRRVTLTGAVPSRAVAQRLVAFATDFRSTPAPVVDDLTVDPAAPVDGGVRVVALDVMTFAADSDLIVPDHARRLDRLVGMLTAHPDLAVHVIGHTDLRDQPAPNVVLAQRRAAAVVEYLVGHGIDASRLTTQPAGESDSISAEATAAADALNRRTEIVLYGLLAG